MQTAGDKLVVTQEQFDKIKNLNNPLNKQVSQIIGAQIPDVDKNAVFTMELEIKAEEAKIAQVGKKNFIAVHNPPKPDLKPTVIRVLALRENDSQGLAIFEGVLPDGQPLTFAVAKQFQAKMQASEGNILSVVFETRVGGKTTWVSENADDINAAITAGVAQAGADSCYVLHAKDLRVSRAVNRIETKSLREEDFKKLAQQADAERAMKLEATKPVEEMRQWVNFFGEQGFSKDEAITKAMSMVKR